MTRHKEQTGGIQLEMVMPTLKADLGIESGSGSGALKALEMNPEFLKSQRELQEERERLRQAMAKQPEVVTRFEKINKPLNKKLGLTTKQRQLLMETDPEAPGVIGEAAKTGLTYVATRGRRMVEAGLLEKDLDVDLQETRDGYHHSGKAYSGVSGGRSWWNRPKPKILPGQPKPLTKKEKLLERKGAKEALANYDQATTRGNVMKAVDRRREIQEINAKLEESEN